MLATLEILIRCLQASGFLVRGRLVSGIEGSISNGDRMMFKTMFGEIEQRLPDYALCARALLKTVPLALSVQLLINLFDWSPTSRSRLILQGLILLLVLPFAFSPILVSVFAWITARRDALFYQILAAFVFAIIPLWLYATASRLIADLTGVDPAVFDSAPYLLGLFLAPSHVLLAWAAYYLEVAGMLAIMIPVAILMLLLVKPWHGKAMLWSQVWPIAFQLLWFAVAWLIWGWIATQSVTAAESSRQQIARSALRYFYTSPATECAMPARTQGRRVSDGLVLLVSVDDPSPTFWLDTCEPCLGPVLTPGAPRQCFAAPTVAPPDPISDQARE